MGLLKSLKALLKGKPFKVNTNKIEQEYIKKGFVEILNIETRHNTKDAIDLVTVAFNNVQVLKHQHRLLKKYLQDQFNYTIADNSSDLQKREIIKEFCIKNSITYLSLPPSPYSILQSSRSHGLAINTIYYNYFKKYNCNYFGILDHDIFPIKPTQLIQQIEPMGLFGLKQFRESRWYLWPGFSFFRSNLVYNLNLNFLPCSGLDTGGSNWEPLFSKINHENLSPLTQTQHSFREGKVVQSDMYEMLGDWMHTYNASNWLEVQGKDEIIDKILSEF